MKMRTEVVGTVRNPDGEPQGRIDGVVIRQTTPEGGWFILSKQEAIRWAADGLLWCRVPYGGHRTEVEPIDEDGDGYYDYIRTVPDHTRQNNLLALPIWDRIRRRWIDARTGFETSAPV